VDTDYSEAKPEPKKRSMTLVIIAIVVIAVVLVAALAYMWWPHQDATQGGTEADWYFKGAYAAYEGEATYLFETMSFSMRIEIVDLNSTHLKTLLQMKMSSESLGTLFDEQETNWAEITETTSFGMEEMEGYTLDSTYDDHVYIEGFGTKNCKVYEFSSTDAEDGEMTMTIYVDPDIVWPLKFSFHINIEDEEIIFNINLTDTNIPALT
jgi:hypothetical protein